VKEIITGCKTVVFILDGSRFSTRLSRLTKPVGITWI